MEKIKKLLKELNLDDKEIEIYLSSIKIWTSPSSSISNSTWIAKSTVRYSLDNLVKKGLMNKTQKWNTTLFTPEHPWKLKNLLIIQKNKLENTSNKLDNVMWDLIWLYNPYTKLPKVTFYEELEGAQKVLDNSLTAVEIIDSYTNVDDINEKLSFLNKIYTKKRIEKNIKKRSIYSSTQKTINYLKEIYKNTDSLNEIKYLDSDEYSLYISFMMYDWKISYVTYKNNNFTWVIIENSDIYNFHKNIFKFMWKHL